MKPCPSCGCHRRRTTDGIHFCVLALDGGGMGACVPAGELPGHDCCSACLTPERRMERGSWYMPDAATVAELVAMGFAGR